MVTILSHTSFNNENNKRYSTLFTIIYIILQTYGIFFLSQCCSQGEKRAMLIKT